MEVNQTTLCDILGISAPTIGKYRKEGLPILREPGLKGQSAAYDTVSVIDWLANRRIARLQLAGMDTEELDSERELAMLRKSQRELNELKAAEVRGDVIPQDEAVRAWSSVLTSFRSRILAVPPRMRSRLPDMPDEAYDELSHLLREALDELSRSDPLGDTESTGDSSAAA